MIQMIVITLTCANVEEAEKISTALLDARLIACARRSSVSSRYWWEGKQEQATEEMLIMESVADKFDQITQLVTTLHSYDTPAITAVPVIHTTPSVQAWLAESIN